MTKQFAAVVAGGTTLFAFVDVDGCVLLEDRLSSADIDVCLRRLPRDNRGLGSYSVITYTLEDFTLLKYSFCIFAQN